MFNKPFVITLFLIVFSLVLGNLFVALFLRNPAFSGFLTYLIVQVLTPLVTALFIGLSHAKEFKAKFPLQDKVKIAVYYFLITVIIGSMGVTLVMVNTEVKDLPLFNIWMLIPLLLIVSAILVISVCIYHSLGLGCKLGLKILKISNKIEPQQVL